MTVHLPEGEREGKPLQVNRLETNLPFFAHVVGNLDGVAFDDVVLKAETMPISVKVR